MKAPPLLPEETLHRVLRVANMDGFSVLAVAGVLALASAASGDWAGTGIGLLVAAAGAIELHGVGLLRAGDSRGMNWLIASQPYLLVMILGYCGVRFLSYDITLLRAAMTSELRGQLAEAGYKEESFLRFVYFATYAVLAVGTLAFQGWMMLYYWRRRAAVAEAVEGPEEPPELI